MSTYQNLPADLRENGRFCLWRYEERDGQRAKVPYDTDAIGAPIHIAFCYGPIGEYIEFFWEK